MRRKGIEVSELCKSSATPNSSLSEPNGLLESIRRDCPLPASTHSTWDEIMCMHGWHFFIFFGFLQAEIKLYMLVHQNNAVAFVFEESFECFFDGFFLRFWLPKKLILGELKERFAHNRNSLIFWHWRLVRGGQQRRGGEDGSARWGSSRIPLLTIRKLVSPLTFLSPIPVSKKPVTVSCVNSKEYAD